MSSALHAFRGFECRGNKSTKHIMFLRLSFLPAKQSATFPTFPVRDLKASPINKNISSLNSLMAFPSLA